MPLECVMFCLDTSNHMRNGDLHPTRLSAQQQSVSNLARFKLEDNLESGIGLLTMAGYKVDVHLSPSRDIHKLFTVLKGLKAQGSIDILSSLKVSQLTLRNRSNKNQRQRIIMYIASPITNTEEQLIHAGKELKKNGIALDLILFGLESLDNGNIAKAQALIDAVQSNNSTLIVHHDPSLIDVKNLPQESQHSITNNDGNLSLTELVIRSPLARNVQPRPAPVVVQQAPINVGTTNLGPAANANTTATMLDEDLDEDLLAAMELSRLEFEQSTPQQQAPPTTQPTTTATESSMNDGQDADLLALLGDEDMDPDLLAAIQLSLQADAGETTEKQEDKKEDKKDDEETEDFNALLEAVSGGAVTEDKKDEEKKE